jgi:hypothetical protein
MTEKEKEENPSHQIAWWYLKKLSKKQDKHEYMKDCWRISFDNCTDLEDIKKTLQLPNFSYDKFEKISWISKNDFDRKLWIDQDDTETV